MQGQHGKPPRIACCTHITVGQGLQEVGLATAVLANQAISTADGQLNGAVADELVTLEGHGEARDLDVPV